jgi:predicted metal-binding protein
MHARLAKRSILRRGEALREVFLLPSKEENRDMEQILEFVDAWMKFQKEFMQSWVKSQKEFTDNWTVATRIIQGSLISMAKPPEGSTKEILDFYQSALMAMVDSSKILADEAGKVQETWKKNVERQMDISSELVKNYMKLFSRAA